MTQRAQPCRHTLSSYVPHLFIKWFAGFEFPQRATGFMRDIEQRRFV